MKTRFRFALLVPIAALLGCTVPSTSSTPPLTGTWTNWQIQTGTAIASPPTNLYFVGALQTVGTQADAVFTSPTQTGTQVLDFTGTFDSSNGNLSLTTYGYALAFTEPSVPNTVTAFQIESGCVGYPTSGPVCGAIAVAPAVAVEIASLTGTYTGTLTDSASPSMSGTGTLTLTQSNTPDSSGAFPLSGTIAFPSGSGLGTSSPGGTISGEGIALSVCSNAVIGPCISLTGSANPTASQITVSNLTFSDPGTGISATYTGTLTRQ